MEADHSASTATPHRRVRVVEDDRSPAEVLTTALADRGYVIDVADLDDDLLARLRAAFRHRDVVDDDVLQIAALVIDTGARVVAVGPTRLDLRPKEYDLLLLLARNVGRVMTHQALAARLWGRSGPDRSGSLRWHVMQLRKKLALGDEPPRLLTEPGIGYRLALPDAPVV
ncbi:MAG: response regulator [Actinomycetia bacterium]|nr:response regulator [Actinomycetes bacterium]